MSKFWHGPVVLLVHDRLGQPPREFVTIKSTDLQAIRIGYPVSSDAQRDLVMDEFEKVYQGHQNIHTAHERLNTLGFDEVHYLSFHD